MNDTQSLYPRLIGARIADAMADTPVVLLAGPRQAGKTTLVRGLLRALGYPGRVKSPSYPLVELYVLSRLNFYHFDFYRFADPGEWETSGFADCFQPDTVCLIEWPERVGGLLPAPDLALTFTYADDVSLSGRNLALAAHTEAGKRCLTAMTSTGTGPP